METCFVIQPFSEPYNQLYGEVFKSAITEAGLHPYRIDEDLGVRIPIDSIEKGIKEAVMCFAEISTNNPNVWYELGFAFACNKDIVMICSDKRTDDFPFDIRHRQIIKYRTNKPSDFEALKKAIITKINAFSPPNTRKFFRPPSQKDWLALTNKETPQWASYQEILKNYELRKISCRFKTASPYFRFGYKLTTSNGKLFGDTIIKTRDKNIIIHVGKNLNSKDLFLTIQDSGVRGLPDEPLFEFQENEWIYLDLEISSDNVLSFYVQHELRYNSEIAEEIKRRLFMIAWGDNHDYKILVNDIKVSANQQVNV
jgi:hypothetical protein